MTKAKAQRKPRKGKSANIDLGCAFFLELWRYYAANKGSIRRHYKELSKKFLDFNDPDKNPKAFLRKPQFEALEIYIFLKEYLDNARIEQIFKDWYDKTNRFAGAADVGFLGERSQSDLLTNVTKEQYEATYKIMDASRRAYPSYIFALTMGTGKTILMATCIFYEFLLANKFSKDMRFCHNALVFAPDKTVLQSLREIETLDLNLVVPPEYASFLTSNIRFHYLEETGTTLSTIDQSSFNIIVSNAQKIILKKRHAEQSSIDKLFAIQNTLKASQNSVYADLADLYEVDNPADEAELTTNQRFEKLRRLEQLGIYVDEAHHAFGKVLAKDMGIGDRSDTSLRSTIDILSESLERAGTRVVGCYNYTGTPYVGNTILPEVVYSYGLKQAVDNNYLKKVVIQSYDNVQSSSFVDFVIGDFLEKTKGITPEGMLPKLAFFASTIEELQTELRPAVEAALAKYDIDSSRILVNVGDSTITSNDDIRDFNQLDTPIGTTAGSNKQFILLVNKGKEGWNCRSLFGVGLFRKPRSTIFVLQATMRCLRAIGDIQHTGNVYLSGENKKILDNELQQNFRITTEEFQNAGTEGEIYQIYVKEPVAKIKLKRIRRLFDMQEKIITAGQKLGLDPDDNDPWSMLTNSYRMVVTEQHGLPAPISNILRPTASKSQDITHLKQKVTYTDIMLVSEIARYLNRPPIQIEEILSKTAEGIETLLKAVNEFNEVFYDHLIPRLFGLLYELSPRQEEEEHEIELVRIPAQGYYQVKAKPELVITEDSEGINEFVDKSFHLDTYCFDSAPEYQLFLDLIREGRVKRVYFTGMLTHGQSDFFIQYIDPHSHTVRSYYPDFLFQKPDGSYVIVEVKADGLIDDEIVQQKKIYAQQVASASGMTYRMIKATDARNHLYASLVE